MTFISSILLSLFCSLYYFSDKFVIEGFAARHNFLYCAPWIMGGIAYLYRETIRDFIQRYRWVWLGGCVILTAAWYFVPGEIGGNDFWVLKKTDSFFTMAHVRNKRQESSSQ